MSIANKLLLLLMIAWACVSVNVYAETTPLPRMGVNVEGLHKLRSSLPFTDLFKVSTGWFTSCEFDWQNDKAIDPGCTRKNSFNTREQDKLDLDEDGWVRSLPAREDPEIYSSVVSGFNLDEDFPLGRYVLLYSGKGEIEVQGSLNIIESKPGRIVFNLIATRMGLKIKIKKTQRRKYIREIHLVAAENEDTFEDQPFDADYIARLSPFESIRFMAWINPRVTKLINWEDRPRPEYAYYTGNAGVPIERMIELANETDAAPWFNMPHMASDDFIRQFARLAHKKVKKDKKIYIEFSNEMWNIIFPATAYAVGRATRLWPRAYAKKNDYERRVKLANNWYGTRTVEMCNIWKRVFHKHKERVVCVIASQSNVDWVGREALDCPLWRDGPCGSYIDAYAVGPYFGDYIAKKVHRATVTKWANSPDGMDLLFKELEQGGALPKGPKGGAIQHFIESNMKTSMKLADEYGLPLLAYEAGQHLMRYDPPHRITDPKLLDFFLRANEDPRMKRAYKRYLQAWEENGGKTLMHFYGIGKPSGNDFFALLPSSRDQNSPKYDAVLEYLRTRYEDKYEHSPALSYQDLQIRRKEALQESP